jgi:hypothetical protein
MNIFFLHLIPLICAQMYVDKHVIKMILETAQLLCSAHHVSESEYKPPYKLTHKNHPCSIWTRESVGNYKWLCKLGLELCKEYTYRYGKVHKCEEYIRILSKNIPPIPDKGFTNPAQAMPIEYKDEDPVQAYRSYYFFGKHEILSWKGKQAGRAPPDWIVEMYEMFDDVPK